MTIQNPPIFIQAGSHPAEDVRRYTGAGLDAVGVVLSTDLAVSQNGTPNMSVNVAGGRAYVNGTEATYQGTYFAENRGVANVVIAASNPTNPRRDLIVMRIRDAAYSGALNTVAIEVITGTAAAVPVDPTIPANCLLLARVAVAALATTVVNADITDLRTRAYALGVLATSTEWTPHTPVLAQGVSTNIAKTVTFSEYVRGGPTGRTITWNFAVTATGAGTAGSNITLSLPVAAAQLESIAGSGSYLDSGVNVYAGLLVGASTALLILHADQQFASAVGVLPNIAVAAGDVFRGTVTYKSA